MKKVFRWIGVVLGILVGLILVAATVGYVLGGIKLNKTYNITAEPVTVPTDTASLERGQHWAEVLCTECHGYDLGGKVFYDDPVIGTFAGSNLTTGQGGASREMSDEELELAIRHAVDHDGRGLIIMPSESYYYLSDDDLGAIIAYLRHTPPINREWEEPKFAFLGRVLVGLGLFGNVSMVEVIDHDTPPPAVPASAATAEYGEYLARIGGCFSCHGAQLNGAKSPDPSAPPAPNLTSGGHLGEWSESDFVSAMRAGIEPDGEEISAQYMPWKGIGLMTDHELQALWIYLNSLPPLEDAVAEAE